MENRGEAGMDSGRFEACYRAYADYVKKFARAKLPDQDLSDDVSQDVFLAFYLNLDRVPLGLEKAWLYRCARNRTIDYLRKVYRHCEVLYDPRPLAELQLWVASDTDRTEQKFLDLSLLDEILKDLSRINPLWSEAVHLLHVEGYSYEEAAALLGVTVPALRTRVYRARLYVQDKYGAVYFEQ